MGNADQRVILRRIAIGFNAYDWLANTMAIPRTGVPISPGQIGPHSLPLASYYEVAVYRHTLTGYLKEVGLGILQNQTTGEITINKAALTPAFAGVVFVESY